MLKSELSARELSAIAHFQDAIKIKTVSHKNEDETDWSEFEAFLDYLEATYKSVFERLECERVSRASLMLKLKGEGGSGLEPFAVLGHMDVVPVDESTLEAWKHPPFEGVFDGEYIYGRGASDMKNHVIAVMEAVSALVEEGYTPARDVYILFGHNEESSSGDNSGARMIAKTLERKGVRFEFVLDEGGAIVIDPPFGLTMPAAMLGLAEKGYADYELIITNPGGHSAQPGKRTALGDMSRLLVSIEKHPMKARMTPTLKGMLKGMGKARGGAFKLLTDAFAITSPIIKRVLLQDPLTAAMVKTTITPTMLNCGTAANVLPQEARAIVNVRMLPGDTTSTVRAHIEALAEKCGVSDRLTIKERTLNPTPYETEAGAPTYGIIEGLVKKMDGSAVVMPYLVTGGTDSREYQHVTNEIYRMYPFMLTKDEIAAMHSTNERISAKSYLDGIEFLKEFIRVEGKRNE